VQLQMLARERYVPTGESDPVACYHLPLLGRLYRRRVARCIDLLPPGQRVLEVGYGSGVSFLSLAEKYEEIHGIDLHNRPGDVARSFADTPLALHLRQGSILDLPCPERSFDAVLAVSIHEHLEPRDQERAFAEVHRVLRPGGGYVVGVPGLNPLMTAAFLALGYRIQEHHLSSEKRVLAAMAERFHIDRTVFQPRWWPRSLTWYACARGWKA